MHYNQMNFPGQQLPTQGYVPNVPLEFPQQLNVPVPSGTEIPSVPSQNQMVPFPANLTAPQFPANQMVPTTPAPGVTPLPTPSGMLPLEQSYIENILRFNRGKRVKVYQTFEYNTEWPAKIFEGIIVEAGRDHLILANPEKDEYYLLLMVNLDYVEFDDPIQYVPQTLPDYVLQNVPGR